MTLVSQNEDVGYYNGMRISIMMNRGFILLWTRQVVRIFITTYSFLAFINIDQKQSTKWFIVDTTLHGSVSQVTIMCLVPINNYLYNLWSGSSYTTLQLFIHTIHWYVHVEVLIVAIIVAIMLSVSKMTLSLVNRKSSRQ